LADLPPNVVRERLGRSSITPTQGAYSLVLPAMQRKASDLMVKS
jgi:hypothetical protein